MNPSEGTPASRGRFAHVLWPVFLPSAGLVLLLVLLSFVIPARMETLFQGAQRWVADDAGWFTVAAVAGFLVFVVTLALSGFGRLRLGPEHSRPDYG